MKTLLAITDLTRMYHRKVCIAGYDTCLNGTRLVSPQGGVPEALLYQNGAPVIFPFAVIEVDVTHPDPHPPHTEDVSFDPDSIKYIRQVRDRENLLQQTLYSNVAAIFEQEIQTDVGYSVLDCQGSRSIGTIQPKYIKKVIYAPDKNSGVWDYRIEFFDADDIYYRLKITDLTWQHFCDALRTNGKEHVEIALHLNSLCKSSKVYLRIGLSRGWKEYPDRCFLQINGVYTFPDYLDGKNFNDFKSLAQSRLKESAEACYDPGSPEGEMLDEENPL